MIPTITAANAAHINKEVIMRVTLTTLALVCVFVLLILLRYANGWHSQGVF
jgi:hypothetical protein